MALQKCLAVFLCWICLLLVEDCDAGYRSYRRYYYTTYYSSGGVIGGIVSAIGSGITLTIIIICCCVRRSRRNANNAGVFICNPNNPPTIVTSNVSSGVTYPPQPYAHGGQYNTAFQYGVGAPAQKNGDAPPLSYGVPAPPYNSVVGQNDVAYPPRPTQENISYASAPPPNKY
ncbi:uncharacterized protein LOC125683223 isoform X1 [Ostrea edulis]|uniref:uncharacterized protein LOC125683223 isoform X1 n=1 Tax=Ostrea edulis TaxID=37623 RepID=UPI0024AFF03A|nr:uncharacterized protein LOC125683223 isoform X1 [Ostrea edulis]